MNRQQLCLRVSVVITLLVILWLTRHQLALTTPSDKKSQPPAQAPTPPTFAPSATAPVALSEQRPVTPAAAAAAPTTTVTPAPPTTAAPSAAPPQDSSAMTSSRAPEQSQPPVTSAAAAAPTTTVTPAPPTTAAPSAAPPQDSSAMTSSRAPEQSQPPATPAAAPTTTFTPVPTLAPGKAHMWSNSAIADKTDSRKLMIDKALLQLPPESAEKWRKFYAGNLTSGAEEGETRLGPLEFGKFREGQKDDGLDEADTIKPWGYNAKKFWAGLKQKCPPKPLHHCSAWDYMSIEIFETHVMAPIKFLPEPGLRKGMSVYEMGTGVGASLQVLQRNFSNTLRLFGSDFSPALLATGRKADIPNCTLFEHDMTDPHRASQFGLETLPQFDVVFSAGALGMYLTKPAMEFTVRDALRLTKPGGTLVFSHVLPPGFPARGSIMDVMPAKWWFANAKSLGVEAVNIETLIQIGVFRKDPMDKRYAVAMRRKRPHQ